MTKEHSKKIPRLISDTRILISSYLNHELKKSGLTGIVPSHGEILYNLIINGDMTMTEISSAITKDRSTVTALVSKLIRKDMVEYVINPEDMRSKKVRLTDKGKLVRNQFINISNGMHDKLWAGIPEDEKDIFIKVMRKIHDNFSGKKDG